MKHHRLITKRPQAAQVSNLQIIKNFLITLFDQIIEYVFMITS